MNTISDLLHNMFADRQLAPDEYLGDDGLIYCAKCRTPRQVRVEVLGKLVTPPVCALADGKQKKRQKLSESSKNFWTVCPV